MTLTQKSKGIYVDDSFDPTKFDSIIFDCDGVLVDITNSYDQTIVKTTKYVLETLVKINDSIQIDFKIIDGFKSTGGFNDEVDLTYAAILSIVAAKKLKKDQTEFINLVIDNSDSTGIKSVETFIKDQTDISEIIEQLSYPGSHKDNILYQIFDQLFYGPELYSKLFKNTSKFSESGLIENDIVIFNNELSKYNRNPCVVFDIDGTILVDGNYAPSSNDDIVTDVYEFLLYLQTRGISIFIITARPDSQANRQGTMNMLDDLRIDYKYLYMWDRSSIGNHTTFKELARKDILDNNYNIK